MIYLTNEERHLKIFMGISAATYFIAGLAFFLAPNLILKAINLASRILAPSLPPIPLAVEKFWLALAFSMMMTITAICYLVRLNVRKNIHLTLPLLIAKATSSLSALLFFLFSARYFAYLLIFLVDGAIFWVTLAFYLWANKAFLAAQTAFFQKPPAAPVSTGPTTVAAFQGEDKFALLDQVLEATNFFDLLEKRYEESGKSREAFSVVIKPNFMFMHSKKDVSTYTDPELVEALVDRLAARGFTNIALVESQSTYGNYYENREVLKVAEYIGYSTTKNYRLVDLTEEMVPFDYGGRLGQHFVGPTWRDADFRISFAKNKTHTFCHYTLALKIFTAPCPCKTS